MSEESKTLKSDTSLHLLHVKYGNVVIDVLRKENLWLHWQEVLISGHCTDLGTCQLLGRWAGTGGSDKVQPSLARHEKVQ